MFTMRSICLTCILLAYCCLWSTVHGVTHSQIGDVRIHLDEYKWQCDQIECPPATHRCFVSKRKFNQDDDYLLRTNICYSKDNMALKSHVTRQPSKRNVKVNLIINSYRSGTISTYNAVSAASHAFQSSNFIKSSMPQIGDNLYDYDDVPKELDLPPIVNVASIHLPRIPEIHFPEIPQIHIPDIPQIHMPHIPEINIPDIPDIPPIVMPRIDFSLRNIDNIFRRGFE